MALPAAPGDPNGVMRDRIIQALIAQSSGWSGPYAPSPYQDIVDPSDPAAYDKSPGDIVAGFPSPTTQLNPGDLINPDKSLSPSTLEAETPAQQEMDVLGPPQQNIQSDLEAPNVSVQVDETTSTVLSQHLANMQAAQQAQAAQLAHNNTLNDNVQSSLNDALAGYGMQNSTSQAMHNAAMNDVVSSALASAIEASPDSGDSGVSGGFGTGTGFSSAAAANDAVGGALADAGNAAGVAGLGGINADGGSEGGGGGGGGGDGGK